MRAPSPSHADSSHVARRRASSAPAHEVDLDELELIDSSPASRRPRWAPPPMFRRFRGKVVARLAEPARFPESAPESGKRPRPKPPPLPAAPTRSRVPLVAAVSVATLSALALVFAAVNRAPPPPPPAPDVASAPAPAASPTSTIPLVAVTSLPRAVGTVVGAQGHRLWIDGVLAPSWLAPVRCGEHVVQVGSAGTPRTVDVPCGDEITVSP